MSLAWKIICWSAIIIFGLGGIVMIGEKTFTAVHLLVLSWIIAISIKCLELGKKLDETNKK